MTQDTTAPDTGNQRLGARTDVVGPTGTLLGRRLFAEIAFGHSFTNIDQTFDQISGGSAGISWTISGVRPARGSPSRWRARIAGLRPRTSRSPRPTRSSWRWTSSASSGLRIDRAHRARGRRRLGRADGSSLPNERVLWARNARRFADVERLRVRRGDTVRARIELRALDDGSLRTERMSFRVPGGRRRGVIQIAGGATLAAEQAEDGEVEPAAPDSLDALLADLVSAPRNDALIGQASFRRAPHRADRGPGRARLRPAAADHRAAAVARAATGPMAAGGRLKGR